MKLRVIQNCFRPEQLAACDWEPYSNPLPTASDERYLFFESQVLNTLVASGAHRECDYFGVVSHRWAEKLRESRSWPWPLRNVSLAEPTSAALAQFVAQHAEADIVSLGRFAPHAVFRWGDAMHPGLLAATEQVLARAGVRAPLAFRSPQPIYFNYFLAKPHVLDEFVSQLLRPVIESVAADVELQQLLRQSSHYYRRWSDDLRQVYGLTHYPLHAFLAERLINVYVALANPRVVCFDTHDTLPWRARWFPVVEPLCLTAAQCVLPARRWLRGLSPCTASSNR